MARINPAHPILPDSPACRVWSPGNAIVRSSVRGRSISVRSTKKLTANSDPRAAESTTAATARIPAPIAANPLHISRTVREPPPPDVAVRDRVLSPNPVRAHNRFPHGGRVSDFFSCFGVYVPLLSAISNTIAGGSERTMNALLHSLPNIFMQHHKM